jgi:hypothetical protein
MSYCDEEYQDALTRLDNVVKDMNGKIVIDSRTGKPLVKFKTGYKKNLNMNDPDAALKQLEKLNKGKYVITCSKCHHCR